MGVGFRASKGQGFRGLSGAERLGSQGCGRYGFPAYSIQALARQRISGILAFGMKDQSGESSISRV